MGGAVRGHADDERQLGPFRGLELEGAELEPADEQLDERRVGAVPSGEAADVGREPWDSGRAQLYAGDDLPAQVLEGGVDVP